MIRRRGLDETATDPDIEARLRELTRLTQLPEPQMPANVATSELDKSTAKLARDRTQVAAQRTIAAELLPDAQAAAEDHLDDAGVATLVDVIVADFDEVLDALADTEKISPIRSRLSLICLSPIA